MTFRVGVSNFLAAIRAGMCHRRSGITFSNPYTGFIRAVMCFVASVNLEVDVETREAYNCMSRKWH